MLRRDLLGFLQKNHTAYGDLFRIRFPGRRPALVALGPAANELLLNDTQQLFSCAATIPPLHNLFRGTLLATDFDHHRNVRTLFKGAFTSEALASYSTHIQRSADQLVTQWPSQGSIKVYSAIKTLLLHMNANTLLGLETTRSEELYNTCVNALALPVLPTHSASLRKPAARHLQAAETLIALLADLVPGRRVNPGTDMFSRLCQIDLPNDAIARNLFAFWHNAHEATALTVTHILYSLAHHQDWQDRLRSDVLAVRPRIAYPTDKDLNFDELGKIDSIEWVFKEVLRLYAPFQILQRRSIVKVNFAGYQIPENAALVTFPHFTHHLAKWFMQPDKFDPLRFAPERAEDRRHPFVFVPFGQGPHQCIGGQFALLQVRALASYLLPRYRIERPANQTPQVRTLPRPFLQNDLEVQLSSL